VTARDARFVDPNAGRFVSAEPIAEALWPRAAAAGLAHVTAVRGSSSVAWGACPGADNGPVLKRRATAPAAEQDPRVSENEIAVCSTAAR